MALPGTSGATTPGALLFAPGAGLDLDLVRGSLALITSRGFHRGQDLQAKLQTVIEDAKRG